MTERLRQEATAEEKKQKELKEAIVDKSVEVKQNREKAAKNISVAMSQIEDE